MKKPNNQLRVKIIGNIHIDHSPYFEFDGTLTYDTDWMDEDPKSDEYMAEYKFRFHPLSTEEDMEFQKVIKVDISRFYRAKDMIKRATFLAFRNDCYEYYLTDVVCHEDDIDLRNNRVINIVGLTNHHTIEKLWKHALYSLISDEESIIYDGEVEKYRIINNDVYSGDERVGSIMDGCDDGKKVTLTYDGNWDMFKSSHHVFMKNVTCFSDWNPRCVRKGNRAF